MLLSTIIGDQSLASNEWEITKDNYDNSYIANDSIRQRIRLGKNVAEKLERVHSSANMAGYEIAEKVFFSNSNKNMNLSLLNFWTKDKGLMDAHEDSNIIYITLISKNYKLVSYDVLGGANIVQTYRRKDEFQGCALEFLELNQELMIIYAKDLEMNRFVQITVVVDGEGKIQIDKLVIEDKDVLKDVKDAFKKVSKGNRMVHFKMSCPNNWLPTSTYIVNSMVPGLVEEVQRLTADVNNASILTLPAGDATFTEGTKKEKDALDAMFQEHIVDERVRAVTVVGARLPYDFCKKYKILYLFEINEDGHFECLRSN